MKLVARWLVLIPLFLLPAISWAQGEPGNKEVGAAWGHLTGNFGLDGLTATFGYRFHPKVVLIAEGDFLWDTSNIGTLTLIPTTGQTSVKSNFQQGLGGGRFFVFNVKHRIQPFGEVLFGYSRLSQTVSTTTGVFNAGNSSTSFAWLFGGGGDYRLANNWVARGTLDFERTHFVNAGQSHLRLGLGIVYKF